MHRTLAVVGCWLVLVPLSRGGPPDYPEVPGTFPIPRPSHNVKDWGPLDYDDTPGSVPGGLVFIRRGNQRVWRFGGAALPMRVKVTEPGPDGPVVTRMVLPSSGQSPLVPLALQHQAVPVAPPSPAVPVAPPPRACVQVQMPDPNGLLYLDGRLTDTDGTSRQVLSPALEPGQSHVFRLRAAFKVGEALLIEDKDVVVRSGQLTAVTFDGARATAVPLPRTLPAPRVSPP
jgi:uncharacterized protein (TIGR03000 family)